MTTHPNRSKTCRPREHLRAASLIYPEAWKLVDKARQGRGKDLPDWPQWCFCPLAASYAIVSGGGVNRCTPATIGDVARLGALAAWRVSQGIYHFDPALYPRIIETPINKLPVEILYRMPEWCVYIETPDLKWFDMPLVGFFAHLEYDANTSRPELRLVLDVDDAEGPHLIGQPLHLTEETLDAAVASTMKEAKKQAINFGATLITELPDDFSAEIASPLQPLISLLLYLCTESADFGDTRPTFPKPKKIKKGWVLFPPNQPQKWDVGVRIGAALRKAKLINETGPVQDSSGRSHPRAHVRKAHWHLYWTGEGRQVPVVKWIPPVPVNVDDFDELPATLKEITD